MADANASALSMDAMIVPVKASTIFAAEEASLFLGGQLIPTVAAPTGVLQVPFLASVVAESLAGGDFTGDVTAVTPTDTKITIAADLIAARTVVRDLGGIDPNEIGRLLGQAVATKFDKAVYAALDGATAATSDSVPMTVDAIIDAAAQIRGAGETGQLFGVVTPSEAAAIMKLIGTDSYAGGDFQTAALRSGFLGSIAGVQFFTSANITTAATSGYMFGMDAARIGMQKNVDVEIGRRIESVGNDVVASLHAGVGLVDAARAVKLTNV